MDDIAVGAAAPDFTMPTDGGGSVTLSGLKGKSVIVYFYPKDDTPGCTTQAQDFTRLAPDFAAAGCVVIGVSKDKPASHDRFKAKHGLDLILASDAETRVAEDWGMWVEKSMYGRTYMGMERSTVLIDASGVIRGIWRKVKVKGHAEVVLAAVRAL